MKPAAITRWLLVGAVALPFAAAGPMSAASAADPRVCDTYANAAVGYNQQNLTLGCGLSGPEWSSDYAYHYDWCMSGRNDENATAWTDWRGEQIAGCRTAKAVDPKVLQLLPRVVTPQVQPLQPQPQQPTLSAPAIQQLQQLPTFKVIPGVVSPQTPTQPQQQPQTTQPTLTAPVIQQLQQLPTFKVIPQAPIVAQPTPDQQQPAQPDLKMKEPVLTGPVIQQLQKLPTFKVIPQAPVVAQPTPDRQQPAGPDQPAGEDWSARIAQVIGRGLPALEAGMNRLDELLAEGQANRIGATPTNLDVVIADAHADRDLLRQATLADQIDRIVVDLGGPGALLTTPDMTGVRIDPTVAALVYVPFTEALRPDSFVLIRGDHFGDDPGRLILSYYAGSGELAEARDAYDVELLPYNGSWDAAWHDRLVVAQVPPVLPGPMMAGTRDAILTLARPDKAQVQLQVLLQGGSFPVISAVTSDSGTIHCCCPLTERTWSRLPSGHNYVYWPAPGRLDAPCGLDTKTWLEPGSRITIHGERFGDTPGTLSLSVGQNAIPGHPDDLTFTDIVWTPTKIMATVEKVPIKGYFDTRPAWLALKATTGDANLEPVAFGPEMSWKWVSGYSWLDANAQKTAVVAPDGKAMIVTHAPSCHWYGDEGESGSDRFFSEPGKPFPDDAIVTWFRFEQIDPANPADAFDVLGIGVEDLASVLLDPASLIQLGVETFVKGLFLSGEGGYHAVPRFYDWRGDLMGPDMPFRIDWETSCEIVDGKPVVYSTSFLIEGPKEALAKY